MVIFQGVGQHDLSRRLFSLLHRIAMVLLGLVATIEARAKEPLIGYTEFRTDLPGGRHANVATMRTAVVGTDGSGRRLIAEALSREPDSWTQFAGWSPDGRLAIVGRGWESPENARWEEEHKQFRYTADGWLYDMNLVDLATGSATNLTAIDRVSFHNSGLFFWPGDPTKLGFQALIDGNSHPFRMDRDGRNKHDLTEGLAGVRLRLQRLEGRPADRLSQELPGVRGRCRRLERPPHRDRPSLQLRAAVVARRQAPALRRRASTRTATPTWPMPTAPASASSPTGAATAA